MKLAAWRAKLSYDNNMLGGIYTLSWEATLSNIFCIPSENEYPPLRKEPNSFWSEYSLMEVLSNLC